MNIQKIVALLQSGVCVGYRAEDARKWSIGSDAPRMQAAPNHQHMEQRVIAPVNIDADEKIVGYDALIKQLTEDGKAKIEAAKAICADGNLANLDDEKKAQYTALTSEAETMMDQMETQIQNRKMRALELRSQPKLHTMPVPAPAQGSGRMQAPQVQPVYSSIRMKAFPNTQEGRALAYRIGRFVDAVIFKRPSSVQWCNDHGIKYLGQQVTEVNQAGGIWVPVEWSDRVIENRDEYGKFRRNAFIEAMAGDTKNVRRRKGAYAATHVGEGEPTALADPDIWDLINLVAKKTSIYTSLSMEQSEDTIIGMADSMTSAAGEGLAMREDLDGFLGDGTSPYGGIEGLFVKILKDNRKGAVPAAAGHSTMEQIDNDDLTKLMGTLPVYAQQSPNKKWYMSGYAYQTVAGRISLGGGGNTITDIAQGWTPMFAGSPVELVEVLPAEGDLTGQAMIGYGDLMRSSTMGDRAGIMFRQSEHALFDTDEIALKWQQRYDIVNHDLGDDVKAGAFVVLVGN